IATRDRLSSRLHSWSLQSRYEVGCSRRAIRNSSASRSEGGGSRQPCAIRACSREIAPAWHNRPTSGAAVGSAFSGKNCRHPRRTKRDLTYVMTNDPKQAKTILGWLPQSPLSPSPAAQPAEGTAPNPGAAQPGHWQGGYPPAGAPG